MAPLIRGHAACAQSHPKRKRLKAALPSAADPRPACATGINARAVNSSSESEPRTGWVLSLLSNGLWLSWRLGDGGWESECLAADGLDREDGMGEPKGKKISVNRATERGPRHGNKKGL